MRFRAFSLGLALGLAAMLPGRAQTMSLSYALNLQPGWNAIANPLEVGSNRVSDLFPVVPGGSMLAKFNANTGGFESNEFDEVGQAWVIDGGFAGTLHPGEGAFFYLPPGSPGLQLNISGLKRDPIPLVNAQPGLNLVGCQSTGPCSFEELMGFTPEPGDAVYFFDQADPNFPGPGTASRVSRFTATGWDVVPLIAGTRAVFVELAARPRVVILPPRLRVPVGANAQFNAAIVLGGAPTGFRWRFNGAVLPNANSPLLTIPNAQLTNSGNYVVEAVFQNGNVTSLVARLTVLFPPVITNQPQSLIVARGATATFQVGAGGSTPLGYQWFFNGSAIASPRGTGPQLVISNAQSSDAGNYLAVVSNPVGNATSQVAVLNVFIPPTILAQPAPLQTVNPGGTVTLSVAADGTPPLMYQWYLNGNIVPGATGPTLTITNFQPGMAGVYRCVVSNPAGAVASQPAEVRMNLPPLNLGDQFPGQVVLSAATGLVRGTNTMATLQPGEPPHVGRTGGRSVWASYISSMPGIVRFRTSGSSFDTMLAAYVGDSISNLVEVAFDDDRGGFLTSQIMFNVQPNVLYRIVVDGLGGAGGEILLAWDFQATPDLLPVFTLQPKSQNVALGDPAAFTVQTTFANDRYQWFFNGQPLTGETQNMLVIPSVTASNVGSYHVLVTRGTRSLESRVVELDAREIDGPGQPAVHAYDKYEDLVAALAGRPHDFMPATQVLGYTGSQTFSTIGSGGQNGEPVHCGAAGGHSKWYSYITPTNGTLFINTDGSSFDTLLAVYTGCCAFSSLTPVDCDNNNGTNGLTSSLSFPTAANTLYFIAVDGVGGVSGTVKLNYRLMVPMLLTNLASTTNSLTFGVNVTPLWPYNIQRSTNCSDWSTLLTGTSAVSAVMFTDTNLPPPRRFYRTMQVP